MTRQIIGRLPKLEDTQVAAALKAIREYVHPDYLLGDALDHGMLYHHGSVSDVVKLFVEHLFSEIQSAKYMLCNSTLLEGVNIPATRLFLPTLNVGAGVLNASQFKNLVGRVCRYKEIFGTAQFDEALLMPEVHLVVNDDYTHKTLNVKNYLRDRVRVDLKKKDTNENPLMSLNEHKIDDDVIDEVDTFLDVIDPTAREVDADEVRSATTSVGYKAFVHNIREIDILLYEKMLEDELADTNIFQSIDEFLESVAEVFLSKAEDNRSNYEIRRLLDPKVRNF